MTIREMMAMYHSLQFVEELLDYIEQYPDDDYMTMECLCRKLVKYKLMKKIDGYYIADRKTEPSETMSCEECKHYGTNYPCELDFKACRYEPKTEPQTEVSYTDSTDYQGDKNYTDHTDCSWR